jgi:hypothetical protein
MSIIKERAIIDVSLCVPVSPAEVEERTKHLTVSQIEALSVIVRTGINFEDCLRLAKLAGTKEAAYPIISAITNPYQ